jgi:predicted ATP-grasp superfamily ATP-dependent carboligase
MSDVLLTYSWVRSSYAALRNLSRHGIRVVAADSYAVGMCQWSKYKAGFVRYPSHYHDEDAFVDAIAEACADQNIRVLLPSHNETELLAKHRVRLPSGVDRLLPHFEHCALFNNKALAYQLARSLGVPVPARIEYGDPTEISSKILEAGLSQVVIKLLTGNSAKGVFYANSAADAQQVVLELIEQYSLEADRFPQIEERVFGEGVGCSVLYWHGVPIADFGHRRLREKIQTGGTSTLREVFEDERIRAAAHKIFSAVGWHGLAMAEFKYCSTTGRFWFIEVNPRMWGSMSLPISAGVEFPYLAWLCAIEGPDAAHRFLAASNRKRAWKGRWLLGDCILAASQLASGHIADAGATLFSSSDSFDDFYWDDLGALAGEIVHYGSRFASTLSANPSEIGMVR